MKFIPLLACLALPIAASAVQPGEAAADNPTAYAAMRLVGKQLGGDSLNRIVQIDGRDGVPQPFLWKVQVKDKDTVQEVEVAGGKIAGQRTLEHSPSAALPVIRLQDLNLDSSGAFEAADTQARKVKLRFDAIEYTLRAGDIGKPVWTLELVDRDGAQIGKLRLAASDGATIGTEGRLAVNNVPAPVRSTPVPPRVVTTRPPTTATTTTTITVAPPLPPAPPEPPETVTVEDEDGGFFTRTGRTLDRTNETVKRNLRKASSRVQSFFHLGRGGETSDGNSDDRDNTGMSGNPPKD